MSKFSTRLLQTVLSISLAFSPVHAQSPGSERDSFTEKLSESPQVLVKHDGAAGQQRISSTQIENASPEDVNQILESIPKNSDRDVVISTDRAEVVEAVTDKTTENPDLKKPHWMVFGKLQKAKTHIVNSIRKDKMGLIIITINTAYDSFLWIHAANLTETQRAAQVIFGIIMAASFGLDKDLWTRTTKPLQTRILSTLKKWQRLASAEQFTRLTSQFTANVSLGIGIQAIRTGLLSMDHIFHALTTFEFWASSVFIATIFTAANFTWGEQLFTVDEAKHPMAKNILRRIVEIRSLVMGNVAAVSKVMQPEVYGAFPILALAIHGGLGLLALLNSEKLVSWIEKNKYLGKVQEYYEVFDNFLDRRFFETHRQPAVVSCSDEFR